MEKTNVRELQDVVIRFSGDSGDGMQLTGTLFSDTSALLGNGISTFPDYPAEIRAPQGTVAGVSGFQVHFGARRVTNPGDYCDVLVAMNPAALKANRCWLKAGATVIIVAVQCVMHLPFRLFTAKTYRQMKVVFVCTEGEDDRVRELFGVKRFSKLSISRQGEETLCTAHILTEKCFSDTFVSQIVRDNPFILSVERSDYE